MTTVTIDLPTSVYERLNAVAQQRHTTIEFIVQEWLTEKSATNSTLSERDRATAALRAAGLLTELSKEEKARAAASTATLEEVSAVLARGGGPSLSELVLAMRGPKE
ncbi:MAG: hypothetical protein SH847_12825 [Roseiflexaceae bacterium]|nr:hypothetical protein [Roseiflexaceae bacterium]